MRRLPDVDSLVSSCLACFHTHMIRFGGFRTLEARRNHRLESRKGYGSHISSNLEPWRMRRTHLLLLGLIALRLDVETGRGDVHDRIFQKSSWTLPPVYIMRHMANRPVPPMSISQYLRRCQPPSEWS